MFNKKIFILLISIALLVSGCSEEKKVPIEEEKTFTDTMGNELKLEKLPERIISLSPAITEILYALELDKKIVGTTDYCDYPEAAKDTPKMGGFSTPNIELIVDSEPDLVFISSGVQAEFTKTFKDLGIRTFSLDAETIDEVVENIRTVGDIMDVEERANNLSTDIESRKEAVENAVEGLEKPLVFFEIWDEPLLSAGPSTCIADILKIAGGVNFAEDSDAEYPKISLEALLDRDPDFYIAIDHKKNIDIKLRPGFDSLKSLKDNQYYKIEDDYVTLPGPRIIEGLEEVAKIIHPEVFQNSSSIFVDELDDGPLSLEQVDRINKEFDLTRTDLDGNSKIGSINCFFTSYYDSPSDINLEEFLRYFPNGSTVIDEIEFDKLKNQEGWPFGNDATLESMPVPIHKYSSKSIDQILLKYAGITLDNLNVIGMDGFVYLAEYDTYYNFTSDFGPGVFNCVRGEVEGNILRLYSEYGEGNGETLTLSKQDGRYVIKAHQKK